VSREEERWRLDEDAHTPKSLQGYPSKGIRGVRIEMEKERRREIDLSHTRGFL
jgi:hypothetical protein